MMLVAKLDDGSVWKACRILPSDESETAAYARMQDELIAMFDGFDTDSNYDSFTVFRGEDLSPIEIMEGEWALVRHTERHAFVDHCDDATFLRSYRTVGA